MTHVILLGDSIFDNAAYVDGGFDVITHLRQQIGSDSQATLKAVDGSLVNNVREQVLDLPNDATHLFVSAGGNDALSNADVLQMRASSSAEVFARISDVASDFEYQYTEMLKSLLNLGQATTVCTIYYPRMPDPFIQKIAVAALATFNDVIIRQAFLAAVPLIDLRLVCNQNADYANEIEPSEGGGRKIANVINRVVDQHDFRRGKTVGISD